MDDNQTPPTPITYETLELELLVVACTGRGGVELISSCSVLMLNLYNVPAGAEERKLCILFINFGHGEYSEIW